METKKYKMYTLYAKVVGSYNEKYSVEESVKDDRKRQQALMCGERIEDLDRLTDDYDSVDDLLDSYPLEVFGEKVLLYEPVIIVDKHISNRNNSYEIYDIVFKDDAREIERKDNIRQWLLDYLMNNTYDVSKFRGICDIYENMRKKYPSMGMVDLINNTIKVYFNDDNYKRYREVYFTLKKLNPERVKKNGVRR